MQGEAPDLGVAARPEAHNMYLHCAARGKTLELSVMQALLLFHGHVYLAGCFLSEWQANCVSDLSIDKNFEETVLTEMCRKA